MLGFKKTVPNDGRTNVPTMHSAPGCKDHRVSVVVMKEKWDYEDVQHVCCRAVNDNRDYSWEPFLNPSRDDESELKDKGGDDDVKEKIDVDNEVNKNDNANKDQNVDLEADSDQGELIRWHLRLGHLPFNKLRVLSALGVLLKRLLKAKIPN